MPYVQMFVVGYSLRHTVLKMKPEFFILLSLAFPNSFTDDCIEFSCD